MRRSPQSVCETKGHEWRSTLAGNFRVCVREECRTAERLSGLTWVDVTPTSKQLRQHRSVVPATLWDERTLLKEGLHPRQSEIEREAEQRYYAHFMRERS